MTTGNFPNTTEKVITYKFKKLEEILKRIHPKKLTPRQHSQISDSQRKNLEISEKETMPYL